MVALENPLLVTHPIIAIFYGSNHDLWAQVMCSFLKVRLLPCIVTGEVVKPIR